MFISLHSRFIGSVIKFEHCLAILVQGQNEEQAVKCVAGLMT